MNMVEILKSIIFLIEGIIFLSLAIMTYWLWARKQGINLWSMLTEQDNPAMSISLCGFLFGSIIAFTGSVSVSGRVLRWVFTTWKLACIAESCCSGVASSGNCFSTSYGVRALPRYPAAGAASACAAAPVTVVESA